MAKLNDASGVAIDSFGNLYIADCGNYRIRKVDALTGIISTIAGNGTIGYSGDGFSATSAQLNYPNGICFDQCGNLLIADHGNSVIRKVALGTIPPTLTIAPLLSDTICGELPITYHAAIGGGGAGTATYQWNVNGVLTAATSSSYTYNPMPGDSVRCVMSFASPCTGTTVTSSNTRYPVITTAATPTIGIAAPGYAATGSVVTVNATVAGAGSSYSIKWYNRGSLFATTTVPVVPEREPTGVPSGRTDIVPVPSEVGCNAAPE
jgi:hypothetical protein